MAGGGGGSVGGLLGVEAGLGEIERLDEVVELQNGGGAALLLLGPEQADELCEAFVEPGLAGLNPGVGEGGEGVLAKPLLKQRRNTLCGGGKTRESSVLCGIDGEHGSAAGGGRGVGGWGERGGGAGGGLGQRRDEGLGNFDDEEAGLAEAERLGGEVGGGDAGASGDGRPGIVGVRGERLAAAAEVDGGGRVALVLDGDAELDAGELLGEAQLADGLEEFGAVAEEERR